MFKIYLGNDLWCFDLLVFFNVIAISAALSKLLTMKSLSLLFSISDGVVSGRDSRNNFQFALL